MGSDLFVFGAFEILHFTNDKDLFIKKQTKAVQSCLGFFSGRNFERSPIRCHCIKIFGADGFVIISLEIYYKRNLASMDKIFIYEGI